MKRSKDHGPKGEKIDFESMMKIYKNLAIPLQPHKRLAGLAGNWITRSKGWMDPDQPPVESTGECEQKMILGGRYLLQEYTGDMMGETFSGINLLGFDNHAGKYVSIWVDSMSTGIYYFEGTASADGKTITQECSYDDPVRGPAIWRSITKIVDDNTVLYEMYLTAQGGKQNKMMEMTLTRKQ